MPNEQLLDLFRQAESILLEIVAECEHRGHRDADVHTGLPSLLALRRSMGIEPKAQQASHESQKSSWEPEWVDGRKAVK